MYSHFVVVRGRPCSTFWFRVPNLNTVLQAFIGNTKILSWNITCPWCLEVLCYARAISNVLKINIYVES